MNALHSRATGGRLVVSVDEVMKRLAASPLLAAEALPHCRAYLESKKRSQGRWWATQSLTQLADIGLLYGPRHQN